MVRPSDFWSWGSGFEPACWLIFILFPLLKIPSLAVMSLGKWVAGYELSMRLAANYSLICLIVVAFRFFFFNSTRSGALCTFAGAIFPSLLNDRPAVTDSSYFGELKGTLLIVLKIFSGSPDCVCLILFSMNSLLLANLTKNLEEARKPASLHSRVIKDILLCNLNCVFGFCNLLWKESNWELPKWIT